MVSGMYQIENDELKRVEPSSTTIVVQTSVVLNIPPRMEVMLLNRTAVKNRIGGETLNIYERAIMESNLTNEHATSAFITMIASVIPLLNALQSPASLSTHWIDQPPLEFKFQVEASQEHKQLRRWLHQLEIGQYYDLFVINGYESLPQLKVSFASFH
jgi:hypothetical protein